MESKKKLFLEITYLSHYRNKLEIEWLRAYLKDFITVT